MASKMAQAVLGATNVHPIFTAAVSGDISWLRIAQSGDREAEKTSAWEDLETAALSVPKAYFPKDGVVGNCTDDFVAISPAQVAAAENQYSFFEAYYDFFGSLPLTAVFETALDNFACGVLEWMLARKHTLLAAEEDDCWRFDVENRECAAKWLERLVVAENSASVPEWRIKRTYEVLYWSSFADFAAYPSLADQSAGLNAGPLIVRAGVGDIGYDMLKTLYRHGPTADTFQAFVEPLLDRRSPRRPLDFVRLLRDFVPVNNSKCPVFDAFGERILEHLVHPAVYSHAIRRGIVEPGPKMLLAALEDLPSLFSPEARIDRFYALQIVLLRVKPDAEHLAKAIKNLDNQAVSLLLYHGAPFDDPQVKRAFFITQAFQKKLKYRGLQDQIAHTREWRRLAGGFCGLPCEIAERVLMESWAMED